VHGERSSGSILFLAFPQELILKLAERTGGKPVRVHVSRLTRDSFVPTLLPTFLVDPLKEEDRNTILVQVQGWKVLLDDDKPEQPKHNLQANLALKQTSQPIA